MRGLAAVWVLGFALCLQAGEAQVRLRDALDLRSSPVLLGAVADITGEPELVARLAAVPVQQLTDLSERVLDIGMVRSAVHRHLRGEQVHIEGRARLRRGETLLSSETLAALAEAAVRERLGEVEAAITVTRLPSPLRLPQQERDPEIEAQPLVDQAWGEVPVRLIVRHDGVELGRALAVLRVRAVATVAVAVRPLRRGSALSLDDLVLTQRELDRASGPRPAGLDALVGRLLTRDLEVGEPVPLSLTVPALAVRAGQAITVVIERPGFSLSGAGVALADASIGQRIAVKRPDGSRAMAVVRANGEAELELP